MPETQQDKLKRMVKIFLSNNPDDLESKKYLELECRFATKQHHGKIMRLDFDNVINKLTSLGFKTENSPQVILKIMNDMEGRVNKKLNSVKVIINGMNNIQNYCKTNMLINPETNDINDNIEFLKKNPVYIDNEKINPVDYDNFRCRVDLQSEEKLSNDDERVVEIVSNWRDTKKSFRYITRYTFVNPIMPFKVDCSIVKTSKKTRSGNYISEYQILESNIFDNEESYEIELEFNQLPKEMKNLSTDDLVNKVIMSLKRQILIILMGLQKTNYPICYEEIEFVKSSYLKIISGNNEKDALRELNVKDFIGPSTVTLQKDNLLVNNSNTVNILKDYTVTEKADGIRKLLFIPKSGKIYLIDQNMNIQFTGSQVTSSGLSSLTNTICDGEHVITNKNNKYDNRYLIFDIYLHNDYNCRDLPLIKMKGKGIKDSRLERMKIFEQKIMNNCGSVTGNNPTIKIEVKNFVYGSSNDDNIFELSKEVLEKEEMSAFPYNTDGLIYTPMYLAVGSDEIGKGSKMKKVSWKHSFKWKPSEFNTIDFLITSIKNDDKTDKITTVNNEGIDMNSLQNLKQYKTFRLRVGYNEKQHGYINPCQMIIDDEIPNFNDQDDNRNYKPMLFYPTDPVNNKANIVNINIDNNIKVSGESICKAENGDIIEDKMIVEFKYIMDADEGWKWKPLRVRYDKTELYRKGNKEFGNAYHVANSVWKSIHNPITKEIIKGQEDIVELEENPEVYYSKDGNKSDTIALRNFHNLYVKKKLILSVSNKGDSLIDLAVGKGGDMAKWVNAELSFVFGVDISKDNINNRNDGVCARYLNTKKKYKNVPDGLFISGDISKNLKNGNGINDDKGKQIMNALLGKGEKNESILGVNVYKQYGRYNEGFNVVSCQFAMHYFFKNEATLLEFIKNVSQMCSVGGYFIGTTYDGVKMFNKLNKLSKDEKISGFKDSEVNEESKIWEITKKYDNLKFEDNITSLGYEIEVYQDSIGKSFSEYLVNYDYLFRIMENCGFVLLTKEESNDMGMPNTTGDFRELYNKMENDVINNIENKKDFKSAFDMSKDEREISFMNRYFILKKVRNVEIDEMVVFGKDNTEEEKEEKMIKSKLKEQKKELEDKEDKEDNIGSTLQMPSKKKKQKKSV